MLLYYAALKSLLTLPFVLLNTSRDHRNLEKDGTIGSRFKLWPPHTHQLPAGLQHPPAVGSCSLSSPEQSDSPSKGSQSPRQQAQSRLSWQLGFTGVSAQTFKLFRRKVLLAIIWVRIAFLNRQENKKSINAAISTKTHHGFYKQEQGRGILSFLFCSWLE